MPILANGFRTVAGGRYFLGHGPGLVNGLRCRSTGRDASSAHFRVVSAAFPGVRVGRDGGRFVVRCLGPGSVFGCGGSLLARLDFQPFGFYRCLFSIGGRSCRSCVLFTGVQVHAFGMRTEPAGFFPVFLRLLFAQDVSALPVDRRHDRDNDHHHDDGGHNPDPY